MLWIIIKIAQNTLRIKSETFNNTYVTVVKVNNMKSITVIYIIIIIILQLLSSDFLFPLTVVLILSHRYRQRGKFIIICFIKGPLQ